MHGSEEFQPANEPSDSAMSTQQTLLGTWTMIATCQCEAHMKQGRSTSRVDPGAHFSLPYLFWLLQHRMPSYLEESDQKLISNFHLSAPLLAHAV